MEREILRFDRFDLPIRIQHLDMVKGEEYRGIHSHTAIEIVEVKSGILHCRVNDDTITLQPNKILMINSNTGHRLYSENARISYIHFDASLLEEKRHDGALGMLYAFITHIQATAYLLLDDNRDLSMLLEKIHTRYRNTAKEARWYLKAYLYELVGFMYEQAFITPLKLSEKQTKQIERVVEFIDANYTSALTLNDICKAAGYNRSTVCHSFKAATGSTVFEYVNFLRAHRAVEKLKTSHDSVLEIATECGFSSATYFNRVFKGLFGCSPSVYRKFC